MAVPTTVMPSGPQRSEPVVRGSGPFVTVQGIFSRAVAADRSADALQGSSRAGRYSRPNQPTLYLSASVAGVSAAMTAHPTKGERVVLEFAVEAAAIVDLRSPAALDRVRREAGDPLGDWQALVAGGGDPPSWRARDWIERRGAMGLIDPSRRAPGLWHLVLFAWNVAGAPIVRATGL